MDRRVFLRVLGIGMVSVPVGIGILAGGQPRVVVEPGRFFAGVDPAVKCSGGIFEYMKENGNTRPFTVFVGKKGYEDFEKVVQESKYYNNSKLWNEANF